MSPLRIPRSGSLRPSHRLVLLVFTAIGAVTIAIVLSLSHSSISASLFQKNPSVVNPTSGLFVGKGYEAQPNERGSILIESAEALTAFEGMHVTIAVDPARASILRVRKTAVTQAFEISTTFHSPGVVEVAIVGQPRSISPGFGIIDVELKLADHVTNGMGNMVDIRLLGMEYVVDGTRVLTASSDGRIVVVSNQDALDTLISSTITDIDPAVFPLVRGKNVTINGFSLPDAPNVFLGGTRIPLVSASPTRIVATIPETTPSGIYTLSVESLLAPEKVVVFPSPGPANTVDILEDLLVIDPNPALYSAQKKDEVSLWIPVYNPLGASNSVFGTVDLSSIGGDPNIVFSGVGEQALGPGGVTVNWFHVPGSAFRLPDGLQTDADYPIAIRVENAAGTLDEVVDLLHLQSQVKQGQAPTFSRIESVPLRPLPGDRVSLYADVSDADGVDSIEYVRLRLLAIGGGIVNLQPVFSPPSGSTPLLTTTYRVEFPIDDTVAPGTYTLELQGRDMQGNEVIENIAFTVDAPGSVSNGSPPVFSGRLEARPSAVDVGKKIDLFVGVYDPDGTQTIEMVNADLISIGGEVIRMTPTLTVPNVGTLPLIYTTDFTLPADAPAGIFNIKIQAIDNRGLSSTTVIPLTVNRPGGNVNLSPVFSGRREAVPSAVLPGNEVTFAISASDPNGTDTIKQMVIDLVKIGGTTAELKPSIASVPGSTNPSLFTYKYRVPEDIPPGTYTLPVIAVDKLGLQAESSILLEVITQSPERAPFFSGRLEAAPAAASPGDAIAFFAGIGDPNGTDTISRVTIDLIDVLGTVKEMKSTVPLVAGSAEAVVFSAEYTLSIDALPGAYNLTVRAYDAEGNASTSTIPFIILDIPGGTKPHFEGRLEAVPSFANAGETVTFFAGVKSMKGAEKITQVLMDLIDLRGTVMKMKAATPPQEGSTSPVIFQLEYEVPNTVQPGVYFIPIRAIDEDGEETTTAVSFTVESSPGSVNLPPAFGTKVQVFPLTPVPDDEVEVYVEASDPNGTRTISQVTLDAVAIGGSVTTMRPVVQIPEGSTQFFTYTSRFKLPDTVQPGAYTLIARAIDVNNLSTSITIPVTVVALPGGVYKPFFEGRFEASPQPAGVGGDITFYAAVGHRGGAQKLKQVTIDLINVGGGVLEMEPIVDAVPQSIDPVVYRAEYTLQRTTASGTYALPINAVDKDGNAVKKTLSFVVNATTRVGPEFSGRKEAVPSIVRIGGSIEIKVGVRHSKGTKKVKQVTVDLIDLDGDVKVMKRDVDPVEGSTDSVVYSLEYELPVTVTAGAFVIPIQAIDDEGNSVKTTLPLTVSAITQEGAAPTILRTFATPDAVPADAKTDVTFSAEVQDADGLDNIETVIVDLSPIDLLPQTLQADGQAGKSAKKGIFRTPKGVRIPKSVSSATYDLTVEVRDKQGNAATKLLRVIVGQGSMGGNAPTVLNLRYLPEIVRPGGKFKLFMDIEDLNGVRGVTAIGDFTEVELGVVTLDAIIDFPDGIQESRNTFASKELKLADDAKPGVYDIPLTIVDETNNIVRRTARMRIERGGEEVGQAPKIDTTRSFQTPRVYVNNNKADGELHVLVSDADDDVITVIANIGTIGTARSIALSGKQNEDLLCGSSRALACMRKGVQESETSRWFVLEDIAVPPTTQPGAEPYIVELTAVDAAGHIDKIDIPVLVGGPDVEQALKLPPEFLLIVPVSATSLELVVNPAIDTSSADQAGSQFQIQKTLDALTNLNVTRVAWDSTARYLYLQTAPLTAGERYTLHMKTPTGTMKTLTDIYGNRFAKDRGGSLTFTGYTPSTQPPEIDEVIVLDMETIDLHFTTQILPSSVHPSVLPSRTSIRSMSNGMERKVLRSEVHSDARTLRLTVEPLREGDQYSLLIEGVLGPGNIPALSPGAIARFFAIVLTDLSECPVVLPTSDLNDDGVVDFSDFALFSSVYNSTYGIEAVEQQLCGNESETSADEKNTDAAKKNSIFGGVN